jgi:hypothetical protein
VLAIPALPRGLREKGVLVFHKYGDRYFLREIWSAGQANGAMLGVTKAERELLQAAVPERVHVAVAAFR